MLGGIGEHIPVHALGVAKERHPDLGIQDMRSQHVQDFLGIKYRFGEEQPEVAVLDRFLGLQALSAENFR